MKSTKQRPHLLRNRILAAWSIILTFAGLVLYNLLVYAAPANAFSQPYYVQSQLVTPTTTVTTSQTQANSELIRDTMLGSNNSSANPAIQLQLSGFSDRQDQYLPVPDNITLKTGSTIEVKLSHSPLLVASTSNLTLLLNNRPISSLRLDSSNQNEAIWTVTLPPGTQPQKGQLQFTFLASMHTNDLLCPPSDDRATWLNIGLSSKIHLVYTLAQPTSLSQLPQLLFSSKALSDRRIVINLPAQPSARDLGRAAQLTSHLGAQAGFDGLDIDFVPAGQADSSLLQTNPGGVNQIYIGGPAIYPLLAKLDLPLPLTNQSFSQSGQPISADTGVIELGQRMEGNNAQSGLILVISGGNDEAVDRATGALLNDTNLSLLRDTYALIQPDSQYPAKAPADSNRAILVEGLNSFSDLHLETQTVYGTGAQSVNYFFSLPVNKTLSNDAQLNLDYSFSGIADPRRSSMTILLNDVAIGAVALNNANGDRLSSSVPVAGSALQLQHVTLALPKDILHSGENHLALRFGLYVTRDLNSSPCGDNGSFSDTWGSVFRSSSLSVQFTPSPPQTPGLAQLPLPFSSITTPTRVVLGQNPSSADWRLAAQLVAEMGQNQEIEKPDNISIVLANQIKETDLADKNLILLGLPANNSWQAQVNSQLPVSWNSDTTRTLNTQRGLKLSVSDNGLAALIETLPSPWSKDRSLLAVIAEPVKTTDGQLLLPLICRQLYTGRYSGNVMVVETSGKAATFNTLDKVKTLVTAATPVTVGGATGLVAQVTQIGPASSDQISAATPNAGTTTLTPSSGTVTATTSSGTNTTTTSSSSGSILVGLAALVVIILIICVIAVLVFRYWRKKRLPKS